LIFSTIGPAKNRSANMIPEVQMNSQVAILPIDAIVSACSI